MTQVRHPAKSMGPCEPITASPGRPGSVGVDDVPEPAEHDGAAMITRQVPLTRCSDALDRQPDDIEVVVELAA